MADDQLTLLAQALTSASQPVALSAEFMTAAGATPPAGLDAALAAAFRLPATPPGVAVTYDPANVGPVAGDTFDVTDAHLSFLGYDAAKSDVTLRFTLGTAAVEVLIAVTLDGWSWTVAFPQMSGWPFDQLAFTAPTFVFSTTKGTYAWDSRSIAVAPGQNFGATVGVPSAFAPILALVKGLGHVPPALTMAGPVVLDQVNTDAKPVILYPDLDLLAQISTEPVDVYFLSAQAPAIGLLVETAKEEVERDDDDAGDSTTETAYAQTPSLYFGTKLAVDHEVTLDLRAAVQSGGNVFGFSLIVDPQSETWLSPAEALKLLAGANGTSFLASVPAPLQQFLSTVGLEGLSLTGVLEPKAALTAAGMSLASRPGTKLVLFGDPTTGQDFAIDGFRVDWTVLNPFDPTARLTLVTIAAEFELWPAVFKGVFDVSIDQDMRIAGRFDGTVSLGDLLAAVTKGAVTLPSGVEATFSAVDLFVDPTARSYAFGATLDATLDFLTVDGKPLLAIQGMRFALTALTPPGGTGATAYRGQIAGGLSIGPLATNVDVLYDGTATPPVWKLGAALAQPLALSDLLDQFFRAYGLPSFLPGSITIQAFSVRATIPTGPTASSYAVDGTLVWDTLPFGGSITAKIGIAYDGTQQAGQQFSGSVIGTVRLDTPALLVEVGYRFGPATQEPVGLPAATGDSQVLWVAWAGIRGEYDFTAETVTISLAGWSVGSLLTALVRTLGDPYFTLESPWDLLNKLSLDGLKLVIDTSANAPQRLYAEYTLSSPIELGFLTIDGLVFTRGADGKVTLAIDGSTTIPGLKGQPLFDPTKGQDVQQMPSVPGQGNAYFELWLLMLGQRVGIRDAPSFDSTQAVITALQKVPSSATTSNPVDPSTQTPGQPYYDPDVGWLVAAHFGLLQVGPVYTLECMVVFNDPDLYGLRLAFNGDKAKVLAGLSIDVLYKKVSDDVGVYQIEFSFPAILRNLDFGAFTVTLPTIGIQIYTNGDFLFDFGFPYNLDFSRSFSLQAVILGVPVLGSAGFYFGKLPPAAVPQLPQNAWGTFSDAIVIGLGVQLGVGRYFEEGPLKAGFSITVFGIIEGAIASWSPPENTQLPATTSSGAVQGDYWFWLQGTFGLIGKLYGSVDFAIVKADVQLTVQLVAQISYEAFANIELSASASVSVSVSIKIDLGLFSIRIHFSFSATITANLTIETHGTAPWYPNQVAAAVRRPLPAAAMPAPNFKTVVVTGGPPTLTLTPAPQFTVLGPEAGPLTAQEGAFVFVLAMDAPAADGPGEQGDTSFEALSQALLPWVLDAYLNQSGTQVNLTQFAATTSVSKGQLEDIVSHLSAPSGSPISEADVESKLLGPGFTVNMTPAVAADQDDLQAGATVFPPFAGLSLSFPDPGGGSGSTTIALADYATIDSDYTAALTQLLQQLAAAVEAESGGSQARVEAGSGTAEPLSQFLFEDWFTIVASQLLQAAADALSDYAYALQPGDSIGSIVNWAVAAGNPSVDALAVATPNLSHALSPGKTLYVGGLTYTVQKGDTLSAIAAAYSDPSTPARWTTSAAALVVQNAGVHGLVAGGVTVTYPGVATPYTTRSGDAFDDVAAALGVAVPALAAQTSLQTQPGLLSPAVPIAIPDIAYETAADGSDTLQGIVGRFAMPLATLVGDTRNQGVGDLFTAGTIAIAGLDSLLVSELWDALVRADKVAQVAGMVARFSLHGMRLPAMPGLTLPANFLYPAGQPDYGLYQLTGQQFPTPALTDAPSYAISVSKDSSLGWLELAGSVSTGSLSIDLSEQARQLYYLLQYAQGQGYDPRPTIAAQPEATTAAKRYALQSPVLWSTSDLATLAAIAAPPAVAADGGPAAQPQPLLWGLPRSLLQRVEQLQAALERRFATTAELLEYLPVVQPQIATTDPASGLTTFATVEDRVFATRVPFQIKRLPQTDDLAPQRPDANDVVPPGPGNAGAPAPLAPYNYELVGPNPADALLLERLLTAMDSLGQELISHLFLLYQPGGAAASGLTSRGDSEFLSFITQTNLSTETNPPSAAVVEALATGPPRGIANSPAEFVKLLWELSSVRSGGYYLYFQIPGEGAGLPDTLFDSSGMATLTLVVAYDREALDAAGGGRLTSFVNAFATTGAVDAGRSAMTVESLSAPASAAALAGTETLAALSALYGTDAGLLVALNDGAALTTGSQIPIAGVVHQIDAQDLASGDPWSAVAAYYSVGAATPITAAELQAYNPGITPALGAAVRIPALTYVVGSATGGPGNTFAGLAGYYGLSDDALGAAAATVPGLFAAGATPTVDSEQRDVVHGLGTGNAGVELTRANLGDPPDLPQNPTPAQQDAFGQAYLFSLYTLLQSSIPAGPFFDASPWGMPFGPRKSLDALDAVAHRDPDVRRAALRAAAEEPLDYAQAVGLSIFATLNAAPEPAEAGLPAKIANPYVGVGSVLGLDLRWVDVFGNVTTTPPDPPPPNPIDYADRLIGLGQWPNVRAFHAYQGPAGQPELSITFELQVAAYEPGPEPEDARNRVAATGVPVWQQAAINDLKTFTQVYFQLNQDYDSAGVPGLAGQAVSMALENSLLAEPLVALSDAQEQAVRDFVAACVVYVGHRANGEPGGTAPQAVVTAPVATEAVAAADVIPLRLAFTLTRQSGLVDPALRPIAGGLADTTPIHPATSADSADDTVTLLAFAQAFETAFVTADWQLRVGTATSDVWAVRMATTPGAGLGYEIQSAPSFFAPKPVAVTLKSGSAEIDVYATGKPFPDSKQTLKLAGADMNAWTQTAFQEIDAFLTATYAAPAFILDQLVVPDDPEKNGYLAKILEHKRTLADAVARTVAPILESSADDAATRAAAAEKMRQALLNQLGAAFTVTAITVFGVNGAKVRQPLGRGVVAAPRFYGQPVGTLTDGNGGGQQNFSLSSAKIPLTRETGDGDTRLAFLFSSKNVTEDAYVPLDLTFAMSQLEHDIRHVPGIDGYEQSQWIAFVTGPFVSPIAAPVDLPVVLRALPQPPTVTAQTSTPAEDSDGETPADLAQWDYTFSYLYAGAAQDTVTATVKLNTPPASLDRDLTPEDELFRALAQFVTAYPAITADIETYVRPIDGSTQPGGDTQNAECAVAAFAAIVGAVAKAYDRWSKPPVAGTDVQGGPAPVTYTFEIGLSADAANGDRARTDVYADAAVPAPTILIEPGTFTVQSVAPGPGARYGYAYLRTGTTDDWLPYDDARNIPARTVAYDDWDVFAVQNAWASVHVVRNEHLVPEETTTDTFRFRTPEVQFAGAVVPLLAYSTFDLGSLQTGPATLESYLDLFFESLLSAAAGQTVAVKLAASYAYRLTSAVEDFPETVLAVALMPPVQTVPGAGPPSFVAPFAAQVEGWLGGSSKPVMDDSSRLSFALEVFAGQDPQTTLPLLTIRDLSLATSALTPPTAG